MHRRAFAGEGEDPELRREPRQFLRPPLPAPEPGEAGALGREPVGILRAARELRRRLAESGGFLPGGLRERLERYLIELEEVGWRTEKI